MHPAQNIPANRSLTEAMRKGELQSANCPSRDVLKHVSSLWGVLCLIALQDGAMRFSELRRKTAGVSEKMLAQTLRVLEADGFIARHVHPVVPPHVEYELTVMGGEVAGHVAVLADWIEGNLGAIMEARRSAQST